MKERKYIKPEIQMYDFIADTRLLSGSGPGGEDTGGTPSVGGTPSKNGGAKADVFNNIWDKQADADDE